LWGGEERGEVPVSTTRHEFNTPTRFYPITSQESLCVSPSNRTPGTDCTEAGAAVPLWASYTVCVFGCGCVCVRAIKHDCVSVCVDTYACVSGAMSDRPED